MQTIETQNAQTQAVKEMMGIYDNADIDLSRDDTYANYEDISDYSKLNDATTETPFCDDDHNKTRYNVYQTTAQGALYDSYIDLAKSRPTQSDYYVTRQEVEPGRIIDDSYLPLVRPWSASHQQTTGHEGLVRPVSPLASSSAPEEVAYLEMVNNEAMPKRKDSLKKFPNNHFELNSFEMNSLANKSNHIFEAKKRLNESTNERKRPEPKKRTKQPSQSAKMIPNDDENIYMNYQ